MVIKGRKECASDCTGSNRLLLNTTNQHGRMEKLVIFLRFPVPEETSSSPSPKISSRIPKIKKGRFRRNR